MKVSAVYVVSQFIKLKRGVPNLVSVLRYNDSAIVSLGTYDLSYASAGWTLKLVNLLYAFL